MKYLKIMSVAIALFLSTSANAAMVLITPLTEGNDGINLDGTEQLDTILGIDVTDNGRVDWVFDADGDLLNGKQLLNPQSYGGLTITGTTFKEVPDSTEAIAGTWNWNNDFGTLDYLTLKFDNWLAIYQITDGDTSGLWDLAELCTTYGACGGSVNNPQPFALSHAVGYSVAVVPVPAAVWLFGSGLLGLAGIARRKTA